MGLQVPHGVYYVIITGTYRVPGTMLGAFALPELYNTL